MIPKVITNDHTMAAAFALSVLAFVRLLQLPDGVHEINQVLVDWLPPMPLATQSGPHGILAVPWGFRLDPLAAMMLLVTRVGVVEVPKPATLRAGVVAVIGIFGLAWLGDSFIAAHKDVIVPAIGDWAKAAPWTFAFGLFFASVLLYSQAATTRALMPLGIALGIPPQFLIAMFPSVNGYFFIPTYGSLIAAINFDLSGTTKIGKYVLNHSFMIPGIVATSVAVMTGLFLAKIMF